MILVSIDQDGDGSGSRSCYFPDETHATSPSLACDDPDSGTEPNPTVAHCL